MLTYPKLCLNIAQVMLYKLLIRMRCDMKTLVLFSSTILISTPCAWAKVVIDQPELLSNPQFQKRAIKQNAKLPDPMRTSLRNIKHGRVSQHRAIHELAVQEAQKISVSDMKASVKDLSKGKVNDARAKFEKASQQAAKPVSIPCIQQPKQEDISNGSSSWGSFFGFGSLRNVSFSGIFNTLAPEETEVIPTPAPVAPQPQVKESAESTTSWFGWASNKLTTSISGLFEEEKPVETKSVPSKAEKEEVQHSSSFFQSSMKWATDTTNWLVDLCWGPAKQEPEEELPLSLEDVEGLETIHLPAARAVVFRTGFENQEPGVIEALAEREEQVRKKYYGERKLSFDEALRKAELIQEENHEWRELASQLPKKSRQRNKSF